MRQNGNLNATVGVFFDSFAKIAVSIAVLAGTIQLSPNIINRQLLPGVVTSLFILNLAYYWQAKSLARRTKRSVTALPCGLQASCVFVWLFAIMLPLASKTHNPLLAYQVALVANVLNALIFTVVGLLLVRLKSLIPPPALFSGLAGSAFTWLAVNNLPTLLEHPLSGFLPLLVMLAVVFTHANLRLPLIMWGVIIGSAIAGLTHEFNWQLTENLASLQLTFPSLIKLNLSREVLTACSQYLPLIIAFAIIDAVSVIQILEESQLSQDEFNPYQSILISGVVSGASAFIGNPFALALFFGHYSWKQQYADHRYPLYNGLVYLALGLTGAVTGVISLVPAWVTLPILIIIGINTTALSFKSLNPRTYPLMIIGMIPIITELIYNKVELVAVTHNILEFSHQPGIYGMFILAKGSILFSLLLTSSYYYIMEKRLVAAACGFGLLSIGVSCGLIHAQTPGWYFFTPLNYTYLIAATLCLILARKQHYATKV
jgi:AGZA family xanthine/uracil permease-like MFS transporter